MSFDTIDNNLNMKLLGIRRGAKYSPNLVDSDAAIFNKVASELKDMGHDVDVITEDEMLLTKQEEYDRVFGMERNCTSIQQLMLNTNEAIPVASTPQETKADKRFFNSLSGIMTCTCKGVVCEKMKEANVPQPEYIYYNDGIKVSASYNQKGLDAAAECSNEISLPVWIKNSDTSAVTADDTVYCATQQEKTMAIERFKERNIMTWVEQKHLAGDLIKFYGVEGTSFFHWQYASHGHSKFGLESINGKEKGYTFTPKVIKEHLDRFAALIDVPIYGGDAIIDADGNFWIIDFNDFPSFSSCRDEAAKAIAKRITL